MSKAALMISFIGAALVYAVAVLYLVLLSLAFRSSSYSTMVCF